MTKRKVSPDSKCFLPLAFLFDYDSGISNLNLVDIIIENICNDLSTVEYCVFIQFLTLFSRQNSNNFL